MARDREPGRLHVGQAAQGVQCPEPVDRQADVGPRDHLEYLQARGDALPGDPTLVAAAIGGMLSMLAYALLPADPDAVAVSGGPGYSDAQILGTLTNLLLRGLAAPAHRAQPPQ
jgi:hypothetical protein